MSNLAGYYLNDTAAAPGICLSIYLSGCPIKCKGCHNIEAQNEDYGTLITEELRYELLSHLNDNNISRSLCILGGEPFASYNIEETITLATIAKSLYGSKVYVWTGYSITQLPKELIERIKPCIDVIIDGPYVQELRDITLPMRGSSNQRIIDTKLI